MYELDFDEEPEDIDYCAAFSATTGNPCPNTAMEGSKYCHSHHQQFAKKSGGSHKDNQHGLVHGNFTSKALTLEEANFLANLDTMQGTDLVEAFATVHLKRAARHVLAESQVENPKDLLQVTSTEEEDGYLPDGSYQRHKLTRTRPDHEGHAFKAAKLLLDKKKLDMQTTTETDHDSLADELHERLTAGKLDNKSFEDIESVERDPFEDD